MILREFLKILFREKIQKSRENGEVKNRLKNRKSAFCKSKSVKLKEDQECKQTLPDFLTSVDFQLSKFKKSKQTFLSQLTKFKNLVKMVKSKKV